MKAKLFVAAGLAAGTLTLALASSDPVVMNVAGRDVKKSEFEYLYRKNSAQQLQAQPLEQYVEMFKTYKRKVADAIAAGIDTTEAFRQEFNGYRSELAAPYLVDSAYIKKLTREAYNRLGKEVEVAHIMMFKPQYPGGSTNAKEKADSIYKLFKSGADFEQLARSYSQDERSAVNGGNLGYITSLNYPYSFENAVYALKDGQVSEVVESPFGYHIIKRLASRTARGTVEAAHILLMTPQGISAEEDAVIKAKADSLYNVAVSGSDFAHLAAQYSDDKISAQNGGSVGWFGTGRMVAQFDSASFAMKVGEISRPVRTQFGYHIIKKLGAKPLDSYEQLAPNIERRITDSRDERGAMIKENRLATLSKKYKLKDNKAVIDQLVSDMSVNGLDSAFLAKYKDNNQPLFTYGKGQILTVGKMISGINPRTQIAPDRAAAYVEYKVKESKFNLLNAEEDAMLEDRYPEFRNLVNEYRDGILLFEISNRNVWERAAKDTEGLEKYFKEHRNDYTWTSPKVKGFLIQVSNDSVKTLVMERLPQLGSDTLAVTIRKEFGKDIKIERVLAAQGDNDMIDNLAFGGPKVQPAESRFSEYFLWDFVMLDSPSAVEDVRGQVTSDYQNELENAWVEELKLKYPVTVNEKILKKIKPDNAKL